MHLWILRIGLVLIKEEILTVKRDRERIGMEILTLNLCWRRESGNDFRPRFGWDALTSTANVVSLITHEPVTRSGTLNLSPFLYHEGIAKNDAVYSICGTRGHTSHQLSTLDAVGKVSMAGKAKGF